MMVDLGKGICIDGSTVWIIRTVLRSTVRVHSNTYFHSDLSDSHRKQVAIAFDPSDDTRVFVHEIDQNEQTGAKETGKLICVAKFCANNQDYFPSKIIRDRHRLDDQTIFERDREKRDILPHREQSDMDQEFLRQSDDHAQFGTALKSTLGQAPLQPEKACEWLVQELQPYLVKKVVVLVKVPLWNRVRPAFRILRNQMSKSWLIVAKSANKNNAQFFGVQV